MRFFLFFFLCTLVLIHSTDSTATTSTKQDGVLLSSVTALTFTKSRGQLKNLKPSIWISDPVTEIGCAKFGFDGRFHVWKCQTDTDKNSVLLNTSIECQGVEEEMNYIIYDSCVLSYNIKDIYTSGKSTTAFARLTVVSPLFPSKTCDVPDSFV